MWSPSVSAGPWGEGRVALETIDQRSPKTDVASWLQSMATWLSISFFPAGNETRVWMERVKPEERKAGQAVSLAAHGAVLSLNTQEEGATDRRQRVGAGGRLPGQASAMQARARQSAPSLPITASGPCSPGPSPPPSWSQKFLAAYPLVAVFPTGQGTAQR